MIIVLIMWFILIGYGISFHKQNNPFGQEQTLALRGICSVEIMMGHIGLTTGSVILYPNRKAGILFVGIFFLLSGYGVAYCTEQKTDYLKNFLVKRAVKILLPAYFIKILMILMQYVLLHTREPFPIHLEVFFTGLNWYVWEQLFFYLIFWIGHKIAPRYTEIIVWVVSVMLTVGAYLQGIDNPWYGSSFCFWLGLCIYKIQKRKIKCGHVGVYCILTGVLAITLVISMAAFFLLGNNSVLGNPIARNVASVSFCIITVLLLCKIRVVNSASVILGKCSYEIFLIHPYILGILGDFPIESKILQGILIVVLTIILAFFTHLLIAKLMEGLKNAAQKVV